MAQRFEGKNVEEALDHAAEALGVPRYQLTYHVVVEKRGFFGGTKRVVLEADVNEAPATEAPPPPASIPGTRSERSASRGPRGPRAGGGGRGRGDRGGRGGGGRGPRRGPRRDDDREEFQPGDFERFAEAEVVPEQGEQSEAAAAVHAWCARVFELASLSLESRTTENDTQIVVKLYGQDARRLTERHGELLDALQVLANKAMVGRKTEKDIELDCAAFKERRTEDLQQRAKDLADRVRRDGREQLLPAMTPIERRIVHLALHDDAEVATESRGEGFYKRVAIVKKSAAE